jgi:Tol biopolymer transport system component
MKNSIIILLLSLFLIRCETNSVYLLFDKAVPDSIPTVFAKELFSRDSSYIGYCSFDNETEEFYYAITNKQWGASQILKLNSKGQIDTLYYNINKNWEGEPMFTPNGKRMYFTAIPPPKKNMDWYANLYFIERTDKGWTIPKEFELNTQTSEWHISFTANNTAYFGSERDGSRLKADIFYTKFDNGKYNKAIKLPSTINTEYNDCDPLIAPDESYLIFHSDRPGGYGDHDLYIAFRKDENNWTDPVNMGEKINTSGWEMGPSLSPDGKYLFFTRRKSWDTKEPSKIYWVDIGIIEKYK